MGKDEKLRLRFESFPHHHLLKKHLNPITLRYSIFCPMGKDEKLRLRFESFPHHHLLKKHLNPITLRYSIFCPMGKDEKLRLRFDSSEARERCRRQRPEGRGALAPSNPSPTTIFLKNTSIQLLYGILYSAPWGRMRSFDQGSTRAKRENVAAGNGPKGEAL
ncbi:putative protamine-like protein [Klebsiella pneumoniae]|nr:putative protamine-like protein [Klebsiella pneumoniae]